VAEHAGTLKKSRAKSHQWSVGKIMSQRKSQWVSCLSILTCFSQNLWIL
jgi:hypothetical protein